MSRTAKAICIRSAKIIDSNSTWNGKTADINIVDGKIDSIGKSLTAPKGAEEIKIKNLHVSPGWLDMQANFCDPGFEEKEELSTGLNAAARGGFTAVVAAPATNPIADNRGSVEYIAKRTDSSITELLPSGAISKGLKGQELAEMVDMHEGGAVMFSDYKESLTNPNLLIKALRYAKAFNGLVARFPCNDELAANGQMNEGSTSTSLGLKGIPSLAEEIDVARDISGRYLRRTQVCTLVCCPHQLQLIKSKKQRKIR